MNAASLVRLEGLRKEFVLRAGFFGQVLGRQQDTVRAVDGIALDIGRGDVLALVGESGSGKTTVGKLLTQLEQPTGGTILFDGEDIAGLSGRQLKRFRRDVQMIFQNPYESLDPRRTVGASVVESLELHGVGNAASRRKAGLDALEQVELTPAASFFDRYPQDLSGGQLQRVSIARALVLSPRLIVADEPVSMLDVSVRSGIMNLMLSLQEEKGISFLFITHDLAVARYMSQRIAVMYLGAIVEEGPTDALLEAAAHPYTRLLIAAVPEPTARRRRARVRLAGEAVAIKSIPPGCRFHTRCPLAKDICKKTAPPPTRLDAERWAACHFAEDVMRMARIPSGE